MSGPPYCSNAHFPDFTLSWTSPSEQTSAKKMEDKVSKAVEVFVGRIRKMENDFIRYAMANGCNGSHWYMVLYLPQHYCFDAFMFKNAVIIHPFDCLEFLAAPAYLGLRP